MAVDRARPGRQPPARAASAGPRLQGQPQPGRPALRALEEPLAFVAVESRRLHEPARLVALEAQVLEPELGDLAQRAQARQRQRRVEPGGDRQRPARGEALHELVEEREHRRVVDAVQVVDDDHAMRHRAGVERVDQLGDHGASMLGPNGFGDGTHQRLGCAAPGQIEGLERGHQALEQLRRRISLVAGDPRQGRALGQQLDLPHEGRGLAEPGSGGQQHQALVEQRLAETALQRSAVDLRARTPARSLDLGQCKRHGLRMRSRWQRIVRSARRVAPR